jgi:hypothetical protein
MGILTDIRKEEDFWKKNFNDAKFSYFKIFSYYVVKFTMRFKHKLLRYTYGIKLTDGDSTIEKFRRLRKARKEAIKKYR